MKVPLATLLVGLHVVAPSAHASDLAAIAQLGPGYVHEDGRLEGEEIWRFTDGQPFLVLGYVDGFMGPLGDLDAGAPGVEYTWTTEGMVSDWGVIAEDGISCGGTSVDARGGRFKLLRDDTPDADLADPATFADGVVILEGMFPERGQATSWYAPFSMFLGGCCNSETYWSDVSMIVYLDGGTRFDALEPSEDTVYAVALGEFEYGNQLPEELLGLGYFARFTARLDADSPIPVRPVTWGRLKQLY